MGKPTPTSACRLIVGGDDWAVELTRDYLGLTVGDTMTPTGSPSEGRYWNEQDIANYERNISVETLYYSEAAKTVKRRKPKSGIVLATQSTVEWDGGPANWLGLPSAAPVDGQQNYNVNFLQEEVWGWGTQVVPFNLREGALSQALPVFPNSSVVYIAILEKGTGSRTVSVGPMATKVDVVTTTPTVREVDVTNLPNNVTSGVVATTGVTGQTAVTGLVVIGQRITVADERGI